MIVCRLDALPQQTGGILLLLLKRFVGFSGCKHTTMLIPLISSEASPGSVMRNTWFYYRAVTEARTMEESIRSCHKMEQDGERFCRMVILFPESHAEAFSFAPPPWTCQRRLWETSPCDTVAWSIKRYYLILTAPSWAPTLCTRIDSYHTDTIKNQKSQMYY